MTRLGVGIVGCGGAAIDMARAIDALPETFVAAAHDPNEHAAARLAGRYGAAVHATLTDLLADPTVDIAYVAVPHCFLAPTAHRALGAGKHVLVEKPAALDEAAIAVLNRVATEQKLRLGVVFELREAGAVREAHRLVQAGAIGPVRAVRIWTLIDKPLTYWHSGQPGQEFDSWRARRATAGGGVVLMNSIHQLDTVRYVTGLSFVRAIAELASPTAPVEVEDSAAALLRLSNGGLANLVAAAHSPGARREERISIDGELGRLDLPDPYGPGRLRLFLRREWDGWPAGEWLDIDPEAVDTHVELVRRFVDAVRTGSAPTAGADDAAAALATVMAIYRSVETGLAADVSPAAAP